MLFCQGPPKDVFCRDWYRHVADELESRWRVCLLLQCVHVHLSRVFECNIFGLGLEVHVILRHRLYDHWNTVSGSTIMQLRAHTNTRTYSPMHRCVFVKRNLTEPLDSKQLQKTSVLYLSARAHTLEQCDTFTHIHTYTKTHMHAHTHTGIHWRAYTYLHLIHLDTPQTN